MTLPDALANDPGSRGFAAALERFDALPVEKVLVWRAAFTDPVTRAHLADALGLSGLNFLSGDPEVAIAQGIALMRSQGTAAALRAGLSGLGFADVEIEEDTARRYDGELRYDGLHRYGADAHWAAFVVYLNVAAPLSLAQLRSAWELIAAWKPERSPASLAVRVGGEVLAIYRSLPAPAPPPPDPVLTSVSYEVWDTEGGGQPIELTGTGLASVTSVLVGGFAVTPSAVSDTAVVFTAPVAPNGSGIIDVVVRAGGVDSNALEIEYWSPAQLPGIAYYAHARDFPTASPDPTYWPAIVGHTADAAGAQRPTIAIDAFGAGMHGVSVTGGQFMHVGIMSADPNSVDKTLMAVAAWTSGASGNPPYSAPLPLLGWAGGWNCLGASAGAVHTAFYPGGDRDAGSGLNDGNPHIIAATARPATSTLQSIYADGEELQSAAGGTIVGIDLLFKGYGASTFDGVVGALVMTFVAMSSTSIAKSSAWKRQQFGGA